EGRVGHAAVYLDAVLQDLGEDDEIEQRGDHRRGDGLEAHLPKTQELLAQQGGKPPARVQARTYGRLAGLAHCRASCSSPGASASASWFMMRTKTSSSPAPPTLASSACVVSRATIRPRLSMAMRPHSASASSR